MHAASWQTLEVTAAAQSGVVLQKSPIFPANKNKVTTLKTYEVKRIKYFRFKNRSVSHTIKSKVKEQNSKIVKPVLF